MGYVIAMTDLAGDPKILGVPTITKLNALITAKSAFSCY
jgi:hypothetical protein